MLQYIVSKYLLARPFFCFCYAISWRQEASVLIFNKSSANGISVNEFAEPGKKIRYTEPDGEKKGKEEKKREKTKSQGRGN